MKPGLVYILIFVQSYFPLSGDLQVNSDFILGDWVSSSGSRTVRIYKEGNKYQGHIIRSNNPTEVSKLILWDLVYDRKANEWKDGKIQLPDMDHSVECFVVVDGKDSLKITGYHGWRIFGKSEIYLRAL